MTPRLARAEYFRDYKIHVTFEDGLQRIINLEGKLWGEVFEPLKNTDVLRRFRVDSDLDTIVWPTGADLAPEFLNERAVLNPLANCTGSC